MRLRAGGDLSVSGQVIAGGRAGVMGAAVNMGAVRLEAGGDLMVSGRVVAGGDAGGGRIDMEAGGDIVVDTGAFVGAEGLGAGDGGTVISLAGGSARLAPGAVISAAALGAGDGGEVEFSAHDLVLLEGELRAYAAGAGEGGSVLVDPSVIAVLTDVSTSGSDYTLISTGGIVIAPGVVISTRDIGTATDQMNAASVGDSGDLTLEAPVIEVGTGAMLLAFADAGSGFASGDILLDAHVDDTRDSITGALPTGNARITVTDAVIWGGDVTLRSQVLKDDTLSTPGMVSSYVGSIFSGTGVNRIDTFLRNQVGNIDRSVAQILAALDTANLPAVLSARAETQVAGSYIIARGNATIASSATTDIDLDPADQNLALAFASSTTHADTLVEDSQIFATHDVNITALATERLRLAAGSADSDAASNMALALSLRDSRARVQVVGSPYGLPEYSPIPHSLTWSVSSKGDIAVHARVIKDIDIRARSGANDSGAGEAAILSFDNTEVTVDVTGFLRTDGGSMSLEADVARIGPDPLAPGYRLAAVVDEEAMAGTGAVSTEDADVLSAALAVGRGVLSSALGQLMDGAALVLDMQDTEIRANFGADTTYDSVRYGYTRSTSGGAYSAMFDETATAPAGSALSISALDDLGDTLLSAQVGSAGGQGLSASGSAIIARQQGATEALAQGITMATGPALVLDAARQGDLRLSQTSHGAADLGLGYGLMKSDITTRASLSDAYTLGADAVTVRATEALDLRNVQEAATVADGVAGSLGLLRTVHEGDVLATIAGTQFDSAYRGAVEIAALSDTTIDTIALRNGETTGDKGLAAAATALVNVDGTIRARIADDSYSPFARDALTVRATDRTWRQIVANASAESGDSFGALGALAYDEYRRDTIAEVEHLWIGTPGMFGAGLTPSLDNGLTIEALSETGANLVTIGRATGGSATSLAGLGAWAIDDRDVRARLYNGDVSVALAGDLTVNARRDDSFVVLQGVEASSNSAVGLASGVVKLGGATRAEVQLDLFTPPPPPVGYPGCWSCEFPEITMSAAGNVAVSATNTTSVFDLAMGGGTADNFGGMGSLALIDLGKLDPTLPSDALTLALSDQGSERADYGSETQPVEDSLAAKIIGFGGSLFGLDPLGRAPAEIAAVLRISGGTATIDGAVDASARDERRASAIAGQLQSGLVAAATDAFTTYFSIDDIASDGVHVSLRPDDIDDAVTTAQDIYSTGRHVASALGDFRDAISEAGTISTSANTFGLAVASAQIGGDVSALVDLSPRQPGGAAGKLVADSLSLGSSNAAQVVALGLGFQLGNNSLGASVSHGRLKQLVRARILDGRVNVGSADIGALSTGRATVIGGMAAGATGTVAAGATLTLVDLDATTLALVSGTNLTSGGGIDLAAGEASSALSLAIAGGGSTGSVSVSVARAETVQRSLVRAEAENATLVAAGDINLGASQDTLTNALVVQGGGSNGVAAGLAISDVVLHGTSELLAVDSQLDAGGDLILAAESTRSIGAAAMGANAAGTGSLTGSISLIDRADTLRAQLDGTSATAGGRLDLSALATATIGATGGGDEGLLAGIGAPTVSFSGGGTFGIGASLTAITSAATVVAEAIGGSSLESTGTGLRDGISVAADSSTAVNALSVSASAGGAVAVSIQVPVITIEDDVTARIAQSSATAARDIDVTATGGGTLRVLSMLAQGSGQVAGGADVEVLTLARSTSALVEDSALDAAGEVSVTALTDDQVTTTSASLSAGGAVTVSGVVQVIHASNVTIAQVVGGSIFADSVNIDATGTRTLSQTGVSGNFGLYASVGGQVFYVVAEDTVWAEIADGTAADHATLDVTGALTVAAEADTTLDSVVTSGGAGLVGIQASILVVKSGQNVAGRIGNEAVVTTGGAVTVRAEQVLDQTARVGNLTGGGAAIGAAIAHLSGGSSVLAEIGDGADVLAGGALAVEAMSTRNIDAQSASISGGGLAFAGSATLLSFGLDALVPTDPDAPSADADLIASLNDTDAMVGDPNSMDYGAGDADAEASLSRAMASRNAAAAVRATPATDGVRARIGAGARARGASLAVTAEENGLIHALSGGVSGGPASFTGALTRLRLGSEVTVTLDDGAVLESTGAIDLAARSDLDAGDNEAIAGAGGAIGGAAAVAEAYAQRQLAVDLGDGVVLRAPPGGGLLPLPSPAVSIAVAETGALKATGTGAGVGAVAVGAVFAITWAESALSLTMNGTGGAVIDTASLDIALTRSADTDATGTGLAGGGYAGLAGVDMSVLDATTVTLDLGAADLTAEDTLSILAMADADLTARATGAAVSPLGAATVVLARAERTANVNVLASGARLTADSLALSALTASGLGGGQGGRITAETFAAAGGGAASLGGSETTLVNSASVYVDLALAGLDVAGDATFEAGTNALIDTNSTGINGGFYALGANFTEITSAAVTNFALTMTGAGHVGGDLGLLAASNDEIAAETHSGQGGIWSAQAARAELSVGGEVALALDGGAAGLAVGGLMEAATWRGISFANQADSIHVALADYGGVKLTNDITADSRLTLAGQLAAGAVDASVVTDIAKTEDGYSGVTGAGGVLSGTSLVSDTDVVVHALLAVADGAEIVETGAADLRAQDVTLAIAGYYDLADSVRVDTGGAVLRPTARSSVALDATDVAIEVGNAAIRADAGIGLDISAQTVVTSEAYVNAYGLAGLPGGSVRASYDADQQIRLASGARVTSDQGSVALGVSGVDTAISAELRLWNATALPLVNDPEATARNVQSHAITVASGSEIRAANDVLLLADEGPVDTYAYGSASDLYSEAGEDIRNAFGSLTGADDVSLDTVVGSELTGFVTSVAVDGTLEAGSDYFQSLRVDGTGVSATDGIDYEIIADADLSAELASEIADLQARLSSAEAAGDLLTATVLGAEIARLQSILGDMGSHPIDLILVHGAYAAPGDIDILAGSITGAGTLIAHGDATIEVINDTPAVIEIAGATIPFRGGGLVTINGVPVTATTAPGALDVQATASAGVANQPLITVQNLYAATNGISGDIYVTGRIENLRGRVSLFTADGDILVLGGDIDAAEVEISSGGDFLLAAGQGLTTLGASAFASYAPLFAASLGSLDGSLVGQAGWLSGIPGSAWDSALDGGGEIIASGGVYVYAEGEVNITGLVQSGVTDFNVTIEDWITDAIDSWSETQRVATLYSAAGDGTSPAELLPIAGASGNVTLRYDQQEGLILVDPIIARGGEIEIVGHIVSTGGGRLVAANGYANIDITNNSTLPVVLSDLSTGYDEGANGYIRLVDLARPASVGSGFVATEYELAADGTVTRTTSGLTATPLVSHDAPVYNIPGDWRVIYASGPITQRPDGSYEYDDDQYGAIVVTEDVYNQVAYDTNGNGVIDPSEAAAATSSLASSTEISRIPYSERRAVLAGDINIATDLDPGLGYSLVEDLVVNQGNDYVRILSGIVDAPSEFTTETTGAWVLAQDNPGSIPDVWTRTRTVRESTANWDYHIIAADRPIDVGFTGHDTGRLTIASVGDVIFNGSVYNRSGPSDVSSSAGSIYANRPTLAFETNRLVMSAAGDILQRRVYDDGGIAILGVASGPGSGVLGRNGLLGGIERPGLGVQNVFDLANAGDGSFRLDLAAGYGLQVSAGGDAAITEITGDMELLFATAGGDLRLTAAGSILAHPNSIDQGMAAGHRVRLAATAGSVGAAGAALVFDADRLLVEAYGDIALVSTQDQDVALRRVVSTTGDVSIVTTLASIRDGNGEARVDRRAEAGGLEALWDSLGLRAADASGTPETAREAALLDAEAGRLSRDYFDYWNERLVGSLDGTPLPYDANHQVVFSADQRAQMAALGMSSAEIADAEAAATARFHALHAEWGSTSYDPGFSPTIDAGQRAALTEGQHWSDRALGIGLRRDLVLATTDTNPRIEAPNVIGRDINLASGGDIGRLRAPYVIDRATGLTEEALSVLWSAERIDITESAAVLEVARFEDLDITATGHLNAIGAGHVAIGSEQSIAVLFASAGGDLRLNSADALTRAPDTAAFSHLATGHNIVLEAAAGGIGALGDPLLIMLADGALVARADGAVRLTAPAGDVAVSEIYSPTGVVLTTLAGDITDHGNSDGVDILTPALVLLAGGAIGEVGDALDVSMDGGAGSVSALALGGDLDLRVAEGDVTAGLIGSTGGAVRLSVEGDLTLAGPGNDPALAALFAPANLADTGTDAELASLAGAASGGLTAPLGDGAVDAGALDQASQSLLASTGATLDLPAYLDTHGGVLADALALAAVPLGEDGFDLATGLGAPSGDAWSGIAAIHAGAALELDVAGSVHGRAGAALDLRAVGGADLSVGEGFGASDDMILARFLPGSNGAGPVAATLGLHDHDPADGVAASFYLAQLGGLELTGADLSAGAGALRLVTRGDLDIADGARIRTGAAWLAALGSGASGADARLSVLGALDAETERLGLVAAGNVALGAGGLALDGSDLVILAGHLEAQTAAGTPGALSVSGDHRLTIVTRTGIELGEVSAADGTLRLAVAGAGVLEAGGIIGRDVRLSTRLGDIRAATISADALAIRAAGSLHAATLDLLSSADIEAIAIGDGPDARLLLIAAGASAPQVRLDAPLGMFVAFAGGSYDLAEVSTGASGLGIDLLGQQMLRGGPSELRLASLASGGTDITVAADSLRIDGTVASGGGDIRLESLSGDLVMADDTLVDATNGHVAMISAGDMVLSAVSTVGLDPAAPMIDLRAAGALGLAVATRPNIFAGIAGDATVRLRAGALDTAPGQVLWVDASRLDALVEGGDMHLFSSLPQTAILRLESGDGSDIDFYAQGDLVLQDARLMSLGGYGPGHVALYAGSGDISGRVARLGTGYLTLVAAAGSIGSVSGADPLRLPDTGSDDVQLRVGAAGEIALASAGNLTAEFVLSTGGAVALVAGGDVSVAAIGGSGSVEVTGAAVDATQLSEGEVVATLPAIAGLYQPQRYPDLVAGAQPVMVATSTGSTGGSGGTGGSDGTADTGRFPALRHGHPGPWLPAPLVPPPGSLHRGLAFWLSLLRDGGWSGAPVLTMRWRDLGDASGEGDGAT